MDSRSIDESANSWFCGLAPSIAAYYELISPVSSLHGRHSLTEPIRFKAIDVRRGIAVHLEVLPKHHPIVIAYRREYSALSALNLPGAVKAFDYLETESCAVLASEWISGESLAERLCGERLDTGFAIQILAELADVIAEANCRRICHLDLRPVRILLRRHSPPLLAVRGFEFAPDAWGRPGDDAQEYVSHILYAPQQRGTENWEVYSWGIIAFELLCGVRPFDGGDPFAVATMHQAVAAPLLAAICNVPSWLNELVAACLEKRPSVRPTIRRVAHCIRNNATPDRESASTDGVVGDMEQYNEFVARLRTQNAARLGISPSQDEERCVVPLFK